MDTHPVFLMLLLSCPLASARLCSSSASWTATDGDRRVTLGFDFKTQEKDTIDAVIWGRYVDGQFMHIAHVITDTSSTLDVPYGRYKVNTRSGQLTLLNVTMDDKGEYTCTVKTTTAGRSNTTVKNGNLCVIGIRKVSLSPRKTTIVAAGETVSLRCKVESYPVANLTWLHNARVLHSVQSNEDFLNITAKSCNDSGQYACRATNVNTTNYVYTGVQITAGCAPSVNPAARTLANRTASSGENITLTLFVVADPSPDFAWIKSDRRLNSSDTLTGSLSSTLAITDLQEKDFGSYTVLVRNKYDELIFIFNVFRKNAVHRKQAIGHVTTTSPTVPAPEVWPSVAAAAALATSFLALLLLVLYLGGKWLHRRRRNREYRGYDHSSSSMSSGSDGSRRPSNGLAESTVSSENRYESVHSQRADVSRRSRAERFALLRLLPSLRRQPRAVSGTASSSSSSDDGLVYLTCGRVLPAVPSPQGRAGSSSHSSSDYMLMDSLLGDVAPAAVHSRRAGLTDALCPGRRETPRGVSTYLASMQSTV